MVARIQMTKCCLVTLLLSAACFYTCVAQEIQPDSKQLSPDELPAPDDPETPVDPDTAIDPDTAVDPDAPGAEDQGEGEDGVPDDAPGLEQPIARVTCYQCNSAYDGEKCESSEPEDLAPFQKVCSQEHVRCRKALQLIQGDRRVIRSCATLGSAELGGEDVCIDRTGSMKILTRTCDCFNVEPGQPCNRAHNTLTSSLYVVLLLTSLIAAVCNNS